MRYHALACDYDGTIAHHGRVDALTVGALERVKASGRKLLLVTGRELDDLMQVFPQIDLFDRIVAENGALLYDPATRHEQTLSPPPPAEFVLELKRRGVQRVSVGRVIVATWEPDDAIVHAVIRDMALELQVIFNKGAVMVLPTGLNKAVGLRRALELLKLSLHNTVGVGDAENDHAFLAACECGVAVANALDSIKTRVDWVTPSDHGAGVVELIDRLIETDLAELSQNLTRHDLSLGTDGDGRDVRLSPYSGVILIAGPSGAGKTSVTTSLLERLCDASYQFCVADPEGDYSEFPDAIALQGGDTRALSDETLHVLDRVTQNAVVSLVDLRLEDRPEFLQRLLPRLIQMRGRTARPHWIVLDEAHHLLPTEWQPAESTLPNQLKNLVLVTIHPDHVSRAVLRLVDTLIVVGRDAQKTVNAFARGRGTDDALIRLPDNGPEGKFAWFIRLGSPPVRYEVIAPTVDRHRHKRKYAAGDLGEDRSFFFRGPDGRLNLRAQNLEIFLQMAEGVDDATWLYHLRQNDVSGWFRNMIKDDELAAEALTVEGDVDMPPNESRTIIREAIQRRYTAPA
jgi:hydroxymethylpyrimidine pyrophosphatase-like HAD family hydrolase